MKTFKDYIGIVSEGIDSDFMKIFNSASDVKNLSKDVVRKSKSNDKVVSGMLSDIEDKVEDLKKSLDKLQKAIKK